jgi:Sigma-70 region 2
MRADDATLARWMALAQQGDAAAYRLLLEASRDWLKRFYARRIAPSAVDDLVQEVLVSLHTKRASYDPERPYLARSDCPLPLDRCAAPDLPRRRRTDPQRTRDRGRCRGAGGADQP